MSSPQPSSASAAAQASQAGLAAMLAEEIAALWPQFDVSKLTTSIPQLIAAIDGLVKRYGAASSALGAQFYRAQRRESGTAGRLPIKAAPDPNLDQITESIRWATKGLWSKEPNEAAAQSLVQGVTERLVLDQGRDTILGAVAQDATALGWARIPEPGACYFCALLATRGIVYKEGSFAQADQTFIDHPDTPSVVKTHDHCRCHIEPVFTSYEPSAEIRQWQAEYARVSKGLTGSQTIQKAWRQHFEGRSTAPIDSDTRV